MTKLKTRKTPNWLTNLRHLMEKGELNPRSLSLQAGLNPTAVRDMFEGRINFPRYDTVQALANALNTTPAQLMGEAPICSAPNQTNSSESDLDLMVEIITRLREVAEDEGQNLTPRSFAILSATLYRQIRQGGISSTNGPQINAKIHDLLSYETIRRRIG